MCVIIWSPNGTIPKEQVQNAMTRHPDGWGFTVRTPKGLVTHKGTNFAWFLKAWSERDIGPVLFHARWATHGRIDHANCHPFVLKGRDMVVAHNGIIPGYGTQTKSDTRDFIDQVIAKLPEWFVEEDGVLAALAAAIGNSKLVFLKKDGTATIVNEHMGLWKGGRWYSNHTAF